MLSKAIQVLNRHKIESEFSERKSKQNSIPDEEDDEKRKMFKLKQKKAYANEFLFSKQLNKELEDEEDDLLKETLENTLFNKFVGKLTKDGI